MEDETHAITNSAASAEPIHNSVGHSFVHLQHHHYPPIVHNGDGSGEPVVVHHPAQEARPNAASADAAAAAADVTAQVAQAIAASASAYMPGYAVGPSHHHHAPYAHHHHDPPTGMEYMAYAAATAMPGPEMGQTATTNDSSTALSANGYTDHLQTQVIHQSHHAHPQQHQQNVEQTTTLTSETYFRQCTSTRQTMDLLLKDQKQAQDEVTTAEDELARAKERLEKAMQNKTKVDEFVTTRAKALTDELLNENSRWNEMYNILVEYKEQYGHCHVMRNPGRKNKSFVLKRGGAGQKGKNASLQSLGQWVGQVRLDYRRPVGDSERLEPYKIIALEKLGFDWQPRENYWDRQYEQLRVYLRENGGKMPPRFINKEKNALGQWCDTQLDNYRKSKRGDKGGYITQEKIDKLNEIGFVWDRRGIVWRENYDRLKEFKETHGHCNATASHNGGDKSFGTWVTKQKRKYLCWQRGETKSKELSLTDEQAALMDAIGFVEAVEMDGRKMRGPIQAPNNKRKYSLLNNNAPIAGLMNATEEIAAGLMNATEEIADHHVLQQPQPEMLHVEEEYGHNVERIHVNAVEGVDEDTNYNAGMDSSTIVNTWGDSANAVSLLVDAMMNREGPN